MADARATIEASLFFFCLQFFSFFFVGKTKTRQFFFSHCSRSVSRPWWSAVFFFFFRRENENTAIFFFRIVLVLYLGHGGRFMSGGSSFIHLFIYLFFRNQVLGLRRTCLNPFTTGNPFLGTKLLGFSIGRGSGALKGLTPLQLETRFRGQNYLDLV